MEALNSGAVYSAAEYGRKLRAWRAQHEGNVAWGSLVAEMESPLVSVALDRQRPRYDDHDGILWHSHMLAAIQALVDGNATQATLAAQQALEALNGKEQNHMAALTEAVKKLADGKRVAPPSNRVTVAVAFNVTDTGQLVNLAIVAPDPNHDCDYCQPWQGCTA